MTNFDNRKQMESEPYVTKRDGRKEVIDFNKITIRIKKLCDGLDLRYIHPTAVARKVIDGLYDGVTTSELDDLAARTCVDMSGKHYHYGILAARIAVSNLHKNTESSIAKVAQMLYDAKHHKTGKHIPIVSKVFLDDVLANADALDAALQHQQDYEMTYFGLKTLEKSYLLKIDGKVVERPQMMLMRVAVALHGRNLDRVLEAYQGMAHRYYIHATPTLFNAGGTRGGLSSCFLMSLTPRSDSIEGIADAWKDAACISKFAGGLGFSASDIRAKGSVIASTNGVSEGIIPMLQVFNSVANYVTQSSKRKGSFAAYLEIWHAEVDAFLKLKMNDTDGEKARELFFGLWVNDLFMERVMKNEDWSLMCPNECPGLTEAYGDAFKELYCKYEAEGRIRGTVKAQKLLLDIVESQMNCGSPYMLFKDQVNLKNNQKHIGTIRCSNLCCEITEYSDENECAVCNLASIGLPSYVKKDQSGAPYFDHDLLFKWVKVVTRNLDRVIDVTHYPIEKAKYANLRHRPMGIGVSGLADTYVKMRLPFDSAGARKLNKEIFETIYYASLTASCELAQELGRYETFKGSEFSKGKFQFHLVEDYDGTKVTHSGRWNWEALKEKVMNHGTRNSLLTTVMPTASSAQIIGYSECIEPYNKMWYKRTVLSGEFQIINTHLLQELCDLGLWTDTIKQRLIENRGSIQNITEIPKEIRDLYKTVWEISQKVLINQASDRQAYIDQSQSLNLFVADQDYSKISNMLIYAHKKKLKCGSYYIKGLPASEPIAFSLEKDSVKEDSPITGKVLACSRDNPDCLACSS